MFAYAKPEQNSKSIVQKKESEKTPSTPNQTGIPDKLKTNFENLSGFSFDDVRVHYNSGKPAKLQALAYTQGNQVYVAPGQEKHLGHELGHVIQQKKGQIHPTLQIDGLSINNDTALEKEADLMRDASQYTVAQRKIDLKNNDEKRTPPIQLMSMCAEAIMVDFNYAARRNSYFSKSNIEFYNSHTNHKLNLSEGKLIGDNISTQEKDEEENINFLINPRRKEITTATIDEATKKINVAMLQQMTSDNFSLADGGIPDSSSYVRDPESDAFIESQLKSKIKYEEIMFVVKNNKFYVAPNKNAANENDARLSHPSLLGGYPYMVSDAGTILVGQTTHDSGHYIDEPDGNYFKGQLAAYIISGLASPDKTVESLIDEFLE